MYVLFLISALAIVVVRLLLARRWPSTASHDPVDEVLFVMTTVGLAIYEAAKARNRNAYTLEISDDSITANGPTTARSIKTAEVQSVLEKSGRFLLRPGLLISKRNRLATWFLGGGIWIPKALPEYDQIRNLALSWRKSIS